MVKKILEKSILVCLLSSPVLNTNSSTNSNDVYFEINESCQNSKLPKSGLVYNVNECSDRNYFYTNFNCDFQIDELEERRSYNISSFYYQNGDYFILLPPNRGGIKIRYPYFKNETDFAYNLNIMKQIISLIESNY